MCPKDAEGIANSVDPDQTALLGAVWSGSALFHPTYLSENLESLWYIILKQFLLIWVIAPAHTSRIYLLGKATSSFILWAAILSLNILLKSIEMIKRVTIKDGSVINTSLWKNSDDFINRDDSNRCFHISWYCLLSRIVSLLVYSPMSYWLFFDRLVDGLSLTGGIWRVGGGGQNVSMYQLLVDTRQLSTTTYLSLYTAYTLNWVLCAGVPTTCKKEEDKNKVG